MSIHETCQHLNNFWDGLDDLPEDFQQADIDALISCRKLIDSERASTSSSGHERESFSLHSVDTPTVLFHMDIRDSIKNPGNYSIILTLIGRHKDITLYRCNGPHNLPDGRNPLHTKEHTHRLTVKDIKNLNYTKPSMRKPASYHSKYSAISQFVLDCNIINNEEFLQGTLLKSKQISFDDLKGETKK